MGILGDHKKYIAKKKINNNAKNSFKNVTEVKKILMLKKYKIIYSQI